MTRTTFEEIRNHRLAGLGTEERAKFDSAYKKARLAIDAVEQTIDTSEGPGPSQSELSKSAPPSQPSNNTPTNGTANVETMNDRIRD